LASDDPSLAGDAAFLLARTFDSPRERAAALAEYLASSPPSPYREQAMVERAHALLDAGDKAGAARIAEIVKRGAIPAVIRPSLAKLEARLAR
jgi:hypothetical protein